MVSRAEKLLLNSDFRTNDAGAPSEGDPKNVCEDVTAP